MKIDFKHRIFA